MQNQFAVYLAAMFGFTSCSELVTDETSGIEDAALVGTWIEVRTVYADAELGGAREWQSTERKTIIVERVGGALRFRNCQDDLSILAAVENDQVALLAGDYPALKLAEPDTLSAIEASGNTVVTLHRYDEATDAVMAPLTLTQPYSLESWTQVCLETMVAANDDNRLSFKARNTLLGATIGMTFEFTTPFVAGTYPYDYLNPDLGRDVTGVFAIANNGEGNLSNPVGTLVVSKNTTLDFQAALTMLNSLDSEGIQINGLLEVDTLWFDTE